MLRTDTDHPADLWVARLDGDTVRDWRRLTHLHPETADWALGPVCTLHWTAPDGTPIAVVSWEQAQELWAAQDGQSIPT